MNSIGTKYGEVLKARRKDEARRTRLVDMGIITMPPPEPETVTEDHWGWRVALVAILALACVLWLAIGGQG